MRSPTSLEGPKSPDGPKSLEEARANREVIERRAQRQSLLKTCAVRLDFLDAVLDVAAPNDKYAKTCRLLRKAISQRVFLVLCGADSYGRRKTYLGSAMVLEACRSEPPRTARYTTLMHLIVEMKSTFGAAAHETQLEVLRRYESYDVLFIDEFHIRPSGTDWELALIRSLLDTRHANRLSTVLAMNPAKSSLGEFLDQALMRRLNDSGGGIEANWEKFWPDKKQQGGR